MCYYVRIRLQDTMKIRLYPGYPSYGCSSENPSHDPSLRTDTERITNDDHGYCSAVKPWTPLELQQRTVKPQPWRKYCNSKRSDLMLDHATTLLPSFTAGGARGPSNHCLRLTARLGPPSTLRPQRLPLHLSGAEGSRLDWHGAEKAHRLVHSRLVACRRG